MADEQQLLELIAGTNQAVLAGVTSSGYPHLTNVLYVWDAEQRIARVSTTATRVKGRIMRRDGRAALHVAGGHFWSYAVAECDAETSAVAAEPGDAATGELLELHSAYYGDLDVDRFYAEMIAAERLVVRLHVRRLYGVTMDTPPGGD